VHPLQLFSSLFELMCSHLLNLSFFTAGHKYKIEFPEYKSIQYNIIIDLFNNLKNVKYLYMKVHYSIYR